MIWKKERMGILARVKLRFSGNPDDVLTQDVPIGHTWILRREVEIFGSNPWGAPLEIIEVGTEKHNEFKRGWPEQFR